VAVCDVWRLGDPNEVPVGEGRNLTSGLTMNVYSGWSDAELNLAVLHCLRREVRLFGAARALASSIEHNDLTTSIRLDANESYPVGVAIPPETLDLLAQAGVSWEVSVWLESMFKAKRG